ncbi:MAG TPA: RagB/SusD family nutrient uptake outer membrane protein [Longimicrobium sp.]
MKLRALGIFAAAAFGSAACDGALDPTPQQTIPFEEALDTPEEVRVAVNAMYDALQTCDGGYCRNLIIFPDLYAGNLAFTGTYTSDREVARRNVTAANTALPGLWGSAYQGIDRANNVLAALPGLESEFDEDEYAQLAGEAHFVRALNYFNLVNFFGGVPLVTTPIDAVPDDVRQARNSQAEIFAFIEAELAQARAGLPELGSDAAGRASYEAATALLARAHTYQREWAQAYALADEIIESHTFSLEPQYENAFEKEQTDEAIFEIPFTVTDPGSLAFWFFPGSMGGRYGIAPSSNLVNSFEEGDARFDVAIAPDPAGDHFGNKYTDISTTADDIPVLRLAEMYLIRAEAAARMGDFAQALEDVNVLRERAGLEGYDATTGDLDEDGTLEAAEVLEIVLVERRHELFYEGHYFFDLKRFADVVAAAQSRLTTLGITTNKLIFPIPQREIDANPALIQNPGY